VRWQDRAACRDKDPEIFFPDYSRPKSHKSKVAKRICLRCPVRQLCLEYAFTQFTYVQANGFKVEGTVREFGIFGGTLPDERKAFEDDPERIRKLLALVEHQGVEWGLVPREEVA
jgi:WhiB family redox-sensing transcriptional regulator